jgi:DNA-binding LacI/PurR family transcriptional regulator
MVTIKKIARELRIAPSTVSRALNEKKGVSKTLNGNCLSSTHPD